MRHRCENIRIHYRCCSHDAQRCNCVFLGKPWLFHLHLRRVEKCYCNIAMIQLDRFPERQQRGRRCTWWKVQTNVNRGLNWHLISPFDKVALILQQQRQACWNSEFGFYKIKMHECNEPFIKKQHVNLAEDFQIVTVHDWLRLQSPARERWAFCMRNEEPLCNTRVLFGGTPGFQPWHRLHRCS